MNNRNTTIDLIKGIAMVMVIWGHCGKNNYFYNGLYYIHLPLFIISSGYLLGINSCWRTSPLLTIISKKAKALLYPFCTFWIIITFCRYTRHLIEGTGFNLIGEIKLLFRLENGTNWFLPILFFSIILVNLLLKHICCRHKQLFPFLVSLCLFFLGLTHMFWILLYKQQAIDIINNNCLYRPILTLGKTCAFSYFLIIGYLLFLILKHTEFLSPSRKKILGNFLMIIFLILLQIAQNSSIVDLHFIKWENTYFYFFLSTLLSTSLFIALILLAPNNNVLTSLGQNSLVINGTHSDLGIIRISSLMLNDIIKNPNLFPSTIVTVLTTIITTAIEIIIIVPIFNDVFPYITKFPKKRSEIHNKDSTCINKM